MTINTRVNHFSEQLLRLLGLFSAILGVFLRLSLILDHSRS
jgi:hypothetical protein